MQPEKNQVEAMKTSTECTFTRQNLVSQMYNTYPATDMTSVHHVIVGLTQAYTNNTISLVTYSIQCHVKFLKQYILHL